MPCTLEAPALRAPRATLAISDGPDLLVRWAVQPARAFVAYVAVFATLSVPWLLAAREAIPIPSPLARADTRLLSWILWWVASSLAGDAGPLLDAPINYPAAQQLTGSEHFAALQVVFLPIHAATGNPILALNAILFLSYPLAAWTMSRLLLALGFGALVSWVIGFAFALGAHQVPTHVHQLHALAFFLPATALARRRLRDTGTPSSAALLGAVLLLAFFTAYYTVAIVLPVVLVWTSAELLRSRPGRARFLATVSGVVVVCLATLATASAPYFSRARTVETPEHVDATVRQITALSSTYLQLAPVGIFGAVSLALALVGCAGLLDRRWRRVALLGLALAVASVLLVCGGGLALVSALPAGALTELLLVPVRFVRMVLRYVAIGGFGLALLGAVALQLATRALPGPAAARALLALAVAAERGRTLWTQEVDVSAALTTDAHVYDRVAEIAAREGRGPLLELPLSSFGDSQQPEAMMGSMRHRLPLVSGHTGYLPPHRRVLDAIVHELPAEGALQDIVDMTHVRWILLRPARFWASPAERGAFARDLERVDGVGPRWDVDGWTLLAVSRSPVRRDWFEAVARGDVPGAADGAHEVALLAPGDPGAARRR